MCRSCSLVFRVGGLTPAVLSLLHTPWQPFGLKITLLSSQRVMNSAFELHNLMVFIKQIPYHLGKYSFSFYCFGFSNCSTSPKLSFELTAGNQIWNYFTGLRLYPHWGEYDTHDTISFKFNLLCKLGYIPLACPGLCSLNIIYVWWSSEKKRETRLSKEGICD